MSRLLFIPCLILIVVAWLMRGDLFCYYLAYKVKPDLPFSQSTTPPAPDYSISDDWAALPNRDDNADKTPVGEKDNQTEASVDVFFLHPTTYLKKQSWNGPLDDIDASRRVDINVMIGQASAFNGCCRVFAPRYRQASIFSLFDRGDDGKQAVELAYQDIESAFDYYLSGYNEGRPFILAGHSQGAIHLERLLRERISASPLRDRMVAAYAVGAVIDRDDFEKAAPDIPICASPDQTGCVISWNAMGPNARPWRDTDGAICVNPLTWTNDAESAGHDLNLGALKPGVALDVIPGAVNAQCQNGRLVMSEFRTDAYDDVPMRLGKNVYHSFDYALFYLNTRANAVQRADAFTTPAPVPTEMKFDD